LFSNCIHNRGLGQTGKFKNRLGDIDESAENPREITVGFSDSKGRSLIREKE
jgi:hypothetical protein